MRKVVDGFSVANFVIDLNAWKNCFKKIHDWTECMLLRASYTLCIKYIVSLLMRNMYEMPHIWGSFYIIIQECGIIECNYRNMFTECTIKEGNSTRMFSRNSVSIGRNSFIKFNKCIEFIEQCDIPACIKCNKLTSIFTANERSSRGKCGRGAVRLQTKRLNEICFNACFWFVSTISKIFNVCMARKNDWISPTMWTLPNSFYCNFIHFEYI